jgi:hypothetical protein
MNCLHRNTTGALCLALAALLLFVLALPAFALGDSSYIETRFKKGSLPIVGDKSNASLYVDTQDFSGVQKTVALLQEDIFKVTETRLPLVHSLNNLGKTAVIIGTIGQSELIDALIERGKIDISAIENAWDGYHIELVSRPFPGMTQALVIAGSNKRGTMYGTFDLSEKIGVSPWHWWADVPVKRKQRVYVTRNTRVQDAPVVKYRGIFLNDEAPALTGWVKENYGDYNSRFYEKVFELLLRLKANFLWPAMWNNAFNDDDPKNMVLADEMGIVMSTSHHEPMMRADKEWNRYGEGDWEYSTNAQNLYKFWEDGAKRNKPYESVFTLGMRGQEDTPMSEGENIGLLERIVRDQRKIIGNVFGENKVSEVPQVWALYKEVQGFYERGMRVPDDVILLWCDDNWGNIRRMPTPEERKRSGGAGVYYHFDYVGGPRSYRWINSTPLAKIQEQMHLAYTYDANKIWVVNVGDLKPMEIPTEFFLRMAWDPERWDKDSIEEFGRLWATREFGAAHAEEIEALISGYTRHNGRRKPELQEPGTYSQLHYREADRITAEMRDLTARAEALYEKIPERRKDAFFQLVLHPVKASTIVTELYDAVTKNRLYANQGRAMANHYAERARELFAADAALEKQYHTELSDGKWNHFMSQSHIGYTHWNNPPTNIMPMLYDYQPADVADMGIAVEGTAQAWPVAGQYRLDEFSPYGQQSRRIEIFNKGTQPFNFLAKVNQPWIIISNTSGQVSDVALMNVSIDWDKAPTGKSSGTINITGASWGGANIQVSVFKPDDKQTRRMRGFVEADGYVSIEAENYTDIKSTHGFEWQRLEQHGRTLSAMSVFPITDYSFGNPEKAPYIEYDVHFFNTGEFTVEAMFAPSLPFMPERGLRYAIAFGKDTPQVVDIVADMSDSAWAEAVTSGVRISRSTHKVSKAGLQKLRIYMVDPGVTLQKLVINTGGLKPSYLGPQQSLKIE